MKTLVLCFALAGCGGSASEKDAAITMDLATTDATSGVGDGAVAGDVDSAVPADAAAPCKALLCDNFEAGTKIDTTVWTLDVGYDPGNTLTTETDKVAHGTRAALAHLSMNGGFSRLREKKTFPALADGMWGRAYFYTPISTSAGHTGFIEVYAGTQSVLEIGQSGGTYQLTRYDSGNEYPQGSSTTIPHNTWVCLEWHIDRVAKSGSNFIEVYIDGTQTDTYKSGGETIAALTELSIGIDNHSATAGMNDVYLDDIAIDAARIGCL